MRPRLVEIDFIYIVPSRAGSHGNRVTIQAALLRKKLYLSFSIGGPADGKDTLPATLVDEIRAGLAYASRHVNVQDLVEIDQEEGEDEIEE